MKKFITIIGLSLFTIAGFAQNNISKNDVPKAVVNSYLSQNSKGTTDTIWSTETITVYKVHYLDNGQIYEASYFADGRWNKTFTEIEVSTLPAAVVKQVNLIYPNHKIVKACYELNNDGVFYATDLVQGKDMMTVYFTTSGKFVK